MEREHNPYIRRHRSHAPMPRHDRDAQCCPQHRDDQVDLEHRGHAVGRAPNQPDRQQRLQREKRDPHAEREERAAQRSRKARASDRHRCKVAMVSVMSGIPVVECCRAVTDCFLRRTNGSKLLEFVIILMSSRAQRGICFFAASPKSRSLASLGMTTLEDMTTDASRNTTLHSLALVNGRIWTGDNRRHWTDALFVEGARFTAVGSS